jgi:hypothetical protein
MLNKIIILITFLAIPCLVSAEPLPWGIAINPETEQCTGFWGGDEFTAYELPNGWVDYYPTAGENNSVIIQTEFGKCNFVHYMYKECCNEIGLEYIEDLGVESKITEWGKQNRITLQKPFSWILAVSGLILILFIAGIIWYFYKRKKA